MYAAHAAELIFAHSEKGHLLFSRPGGCLSLYMVGSDARDRLEQNNAPNYRSCSACEIIMSLPEDIKVGTQMSCMGEAGLRAEPAASGRKPAA
jgi:hypothetical protein